MLRKLTSLMILAVSLFILNASAVTVQSQSTEIPPLTEPGPYAVGLKFMDFVDEQREDWHLETHVYFPADPEQGRTMNPNSPLRIGAIPDLSGAPYPLIVYSHGGGGDNTDLSRVLEHLASQGYIVAAPQHHDTDEVYTGIEFVDRPLDIMTVLDALAAITDGDLAGMIDTDNVGLMGWSLGAEASLQMLGLQSDPVHFETWCAEHPEANLDCADVRLDLTEAYRAQLGLQTMPDGTWAPFGDERIRAVLVFAPCYFPLTNEATLVSVTTPTMILHATLDNGCDYTGNAVRAYTHLGTEDRYLITLVNRDHIIYYIQQPIPQHFATAFFGTYLKNDNSYTPYLTPEGLPTEQFPGQVGGPYEAG